MTGKIIIVYCEMIANSENFNEFCHIFYEDVILDIVPYETLKSSNFIYNVYRIVFDMHVRTLTNE